MAKYLMFNLFELYTRVMKQAHVTLKYLNVVRMHPYFKRFITDMFAYVTFTEVPYVLRSFNHQTIIYI